MHICMYDVEIMNAYFVQKWSSFLVNSDSGAFPLTFNDATWWTIVA